MIGPPLWTGVPGVNPDLLPIVIANYRSDYLIEKEVGVRQPGAYSPIMDAGPAIGAAADEPRPRF